MTVTLFGKNVTLVLCQVVVRTIGKLHTRGRFKFKLPVHHLYYITFIHVTVSFLMPKSLEAGPLAIQLSKKANLKNIILPVLGKDNKLANRCKTICLIFYFYVNDRNFQLFQPDLYKR